MKKKKRNEYEANVKIINEDINEHETGDEDIGDINDHESGDDNNIEESYNEAIISIATISISNHQPFMPEMLHYFIHLLFIKDLSLKAIFS